MKKQILSLTLTAGILAVSPAFAMLDEHSIENKNTLSKKSEDLSQESVQGKASFVQECEGSHVKESPDTIESYLKKATNVVESHGPNESYIVLHTGAGWAYNPEEGTFYGISIADHFAAMMKAIGEGASNEK